MNQEANRRMKKWCIDNDVMRCELCGRVDFLSYAHRQKRRYYNSAEELSDPNEFLLLCIPCHQKIEYDKRLTEQAFKKLR